MMTLQTSQPEAHTDEFFWIQWVLANAVGLAVGDVGSLSVGLYGASLLLLIGAQSESVAGPVSGIFSWIFLWMSSIFDAVAIGAAHWFFWRRRVRWAGAWFLATSLGRLASQFVVLSLGWLGSQFTIPSLFSSPGTAPFSPVFGPPSLFIISAAFGIVSVVLVASLQWLILCRHVNGAGWWVVANIAGAAVGSVGSLIGAIASGFATVVISPTGNCIWLSLPELVLPQLERRPAPSPGSP